MARKPAPQRVLARLLEGTPAPLYLCDAEGKFAFANDAFDRWLGGAAAGLVGLALPYSLATEEAGANAIVAALAPPPECYLGKRRAAVISVARPAGGVTRRRVDFLPVAEEGSRFAVLALVAIQEAEEAELPADASSADAHAALAELRSKLGAKYLLPQLIGRSRALQQVREQVQLAATSGTRTLVLGPPGSGREHVARTIHQLRPSGALLPIVGSAVTAEQLQATVVAGLRKNSAAAAKVRPTLLLLDVDQLEPAAQLELASLLQLPGMEIQTLATARRSLHRLADRGRYRQDLAFALSTFTIKLPPLKQRPEDIPLLAQLALERQNAARDKQLSGFTAEALDELAGYEWPGNVQELMQIVAESFAQARGPQIGSADLPAILRIAAGAVAHPKREPERIQLDAVLEEVEREILSRALAFARNNKSLAAEMLGISRQRLIRRLVQFGLVAPLAEETVIFEPVEEGESSEEKAS